MLVLSNAFVHIHSVLGHQESQLLYSNLASRLSAPTQGIAGKPN